MGTAIVKTGKGLRTTHGNGGRMLKGRYVAQIEVDFQCEESQIEIDTKELCERMHGGWMEETVSKMVGQIFKGVRGTVKTTQQYADLIETEE